MPPSAISESFRLVKLFRSSANSWLSCVVAADSAIELSEESCRVNPKSKDIVKVIVTEVLPGTPAYDAGLRPLDVVIFFKGQPVNHHDDFIQMIRNGPIGEALEIIYVRNGEETTVSVTLIERPE